MANEEHVAILKKGVPAWNDWRGRNPDIKPELARAQLCGEDLSGADFHGADLSEADCSVANLEQANFNDANLRNGNLMLAKLQGATLWNADLTGTDFMHADLSGAGVLGVRWARGKMRGKYLGIRGLDSCFGNALFRRDAADQDFLDSLEEKWRGTWRMALLFLWGYLDYGRSMGRVAAFAFGVMFLYGTLYATSHSSLSYSGSANTWFTPYYFSIVTFTTLGFGDVRPANVVGEMLASSEVIIGYVTLGLLLAVLAEKLARRS